MVPGAGGSQPHVLHGTTQGCLRELPGGEANDLGHPAWLLQAKPEDS